MITVFNLCDNSQQYYTCSPKEAVVAAYAQKLGDFNTWDYKKYNNLIEEGKLVFCCGDFAAFKNSKEF